MWFTGLSGLGSCSLQRIGELIQAPPAIRRGAPIFFGILPCRLGRRSKPAPHPPLIGQILLPEFSFQITLLAGDDAPGTPPQLMVELFCSLSGIKIVFVPYKGAAPALTDLLAGRTQMTMLSTTMIVPQILDGRLRALAVTSTTRWHELPDVPTMEESGFSGFPQGSWTAVVAPAGTPAEVVTKLNATINEGLHSAELRGGLTRLGAEIKTDTPQQLGALLADETKKWGEVIKSSGAAVN